MGFGFFLAGGFDSDAVGLGVGVARVGVAVGPVAVVGLAVAAADVLDTAGVGTSGGGAVVPAELLQPIARTSPAVAAIVVARTDRVSPMGGSADDVLRFIPIAVVGGRYA